MVQTGDRAVALFVVQRTDCDAFAACADLDPKFARALDEVAEIGVDVLVYACGITPESVQITHPLPWKR